MEVVDTQEKSTRKIIVSWILPIFGCLLLAWFITTFVIRSVEVDGYSMSPTLSDGDRALTLGIEGKIKRFDIVIVKKSSGNLKGQELVKRVIALPGETIEYKDGTLYINDKVVEEDFIEEVVKELTGTISKRTLEDDEYFVMGDNRGNSSDSRYFGAVKRNEITGKNIFRFMVCVEKDSNNECSKRKLVWPSKVK